MNLKSIIVLKTNLLLHNRKLYLAYGMALCLVTLTDLQTRRAGLSASAELLVEICSGIVEGSVIGPLLFVLFINDIIEIFSDGSCVCKLFADDVKMPPST